MNRIKLLIAIIPVIFLMTGCFGNPYNKYRIEGKIAGKEFEQGMIYLKDAANPEIKFDSAKIIDGSFRFIGIQEIPVVRMLVLEKVGVDFPLLVPVVLENGNIRVILGEVVYIRGTYLNNKLQDILLSLDRFSEYVKTSNIDKEMAKYELKELLQKEAHRNKKDTVHIIV